MRALPILLSDTDCTVKTASWDLGAEEVAMVMTILKPGQRHGLHNHAEAGLEELYVLIDGSSDIIVGDETFHAEAVEFFYLPPDIMRAVHNNSDRDATWIFVAPMRGELRDVYSKVGPQ